eukprot:4827488-Prymnesium_polylepis.1
MFSLALRLRSGYGSAYARSAKRRFPNHSIRELSRKAFAKVSLVIPPRALARVRKPRVGARRMEKEGLCLWGKLSPRAHSPRVGSRASDFHPRLCANTVCCAAPPFPGRS